MKKFLAPLIVLLLVVFLPVSNSFGTVLGFVDLPGEVEAGITAVVVWVISWIFVQLITLIPLLAFLEQFKLPLALAISAQLITWAEVIIPDAFGGVAIAGIVFILAILALFGIGEQLRKQEAPGFRSR